jgi:hypothetical protein
MKLLLRYGLIYANNFSYTSQHRPYPSFKKNLVITFIIRSPYNFCIQHFTLALEVCIVLNYDIPPHLTLDWDEIFQISDSELSQVCLSEHMTSNHEQFNFMYIFF